MTLIILRIPNNECVIICYLKTFFYDNQKASPMLLKRFKIQSYHFFEFLVLDLYDAAIFFLRLELKIAEMASDA